MNVLVTGGTGFVGLNLAVALAERHGVIVGDIQPWSSDLDRALETSLERLTYVTLDVRDAEQVRAVVLAHRITHVVHAAAITCPDSAARAPEIVGVNLTGSVNVLDAALASPTVERVLVVSSSGVYLGRAGNEPLDEDAPVEDTSLYTVTKVSAERLAARYASLSGKRMAAVRLPAVYGPFERPRASRPHTSTVRHLMDALVERRPVRVAGPDVARDWTFAPEIGAAVRALLEAPEWSWPVYNVSNGLRITLRDVVEAFAQHGMHAMWIDDAARADEAMRAEDARAPLITARLEHDAQYRPSLSFAEGLAAWLQSEPLP